MGCRALTALILIVWLLASCEAPPPGIMERIKHFFNPFGYTLDMGDHIDNFKFTYILIRSSFRPPDNTKIKTFPSDSNYKRRWKKGELTKTGGKLAKMIGRSLEYSRYGTIMAIKWVERTAPVRISMINKPYAVSTAEEFEEGYLQDYREKMHYAPRYYADFDKTELFEKSELCPEYDYLWKSVQQYQEKEFLARPENQQFLTELRQNIKSPENVQDEWYVDSLKKVYWLHEVLDFEKVTRNRKPSWMTKNVRAKMDEFVLEYLKESIHGDERMAKYLVGPLLNEILEKDKDGYTRLHAHVTDERIFAAFKSVISDAPATPTEFGEMILIDVDGARNVLVINFFPVSNTIMKIPVNFNNLMEFESKFSNYLLPEVEWQAACRGEKYNGNKASTTSHNAWPMTYNGADTDLYSRDTAKQQVSDKWSYMAFPTLYNPETTSTKGSGYGPVSSQADPKDEKFWLNMRWKDDDYKSRGEYYREAREPIKNQEKDSKSKRTVVRPVIKPYTPWKPQVEDEITYSSEEEIPAKSRDHANTDTSLSPPSTSGTDSVGSGGLGSYRSESGRLGSYGTELDRSASYGRDSDRLGSYGRESDRLGSYGRESDRLGSYGGDSDRLGSYGTGSGGLGSYDGTRSSSFKSQPTGNKVSYEPSRIVENIFPLQRTPTKPTEGVIDSAQLQHLNIDFKDGRDYFSMLPKKGDFASGYVDKTQNGIKTTQHSQYRMVDKEQYYQERDGDCFGYDGRRIECYRAHQIDTNRFMTHRSQITHDPVY